MLRPHHNRSLFTALALPLLAAGCVAYRPDPVDPEESLAALDAREAGQLDLAAAVAFAHAHNPELARLLAEAEAAGLDVPATVVGSRGNFNQEHASATADPFALLRLGPRGRAFAEADAERRRLLATLRREQWRVAGAIAESYAVLAVLEVRSRPDLGVEAAPFREAGLAAETELLVLEQARASADAEAEEIEALRQATEARLRALLGLGSNAPVAVEPGGGLARPAGPVGRDALLARPDVAESLARFSVADAALRRAVADQYPRLRLGREVNLDQSGAGSIVAVELPIGASRRARAAQRRREAARRAVEAALLDTERDAAERLAERRTARARLRHEEAALAATRARHELALARLEVDPDAFGQAVTVAHDLAARLTRHRRAAVDVARAEVALAVASGWPVPPAQTTDGATEDKPHE